MMIEQKTEKEKLTNLILEKLKGEATAARKLVYRRNCLPCTGVRMVLECLCK